MTVYILALVLFNINNGSVNTFLTATSFTTEIECFNAKEKVMKDLDKVPNTEKQDRHYLMRCIESKVKQKAN